MRPGRRGVRSVLWRVTRVVGIRVRTSGQPARVAVEWVVFRGVPACYVFLCVHVFCFIQYDVGGVGVAIGEHYANANSKGAVELKSSLSVFLSS